MKRILILSAIFASCSFSPTPMATTWAGTASNQAVTGTSMADAITTSVLPSRCATSVFTDLGLRLITKSQLECFPSVNIEATALAAKTNNQLVVKGDFVQYANSLSVYQRSNGTFLTACGVVFASETGGQYNTIYYNGTLGVGTRFRSLASLTGVDPALKFSGQAKGLSYTTISVVYSLYEVTATCEP